MGLGWIYDGPYGNRSLVLGLGQWGCLFIGVAWTDVEGTIYASLMMDTGVALTVDPC